MTAIDPADLPHRVLREDLWVPLRDGVHLRARVWRPAEADQPVPALLEYLPYRASEWTRKRDEERHPWYAGHGYASIRVDIRGTGDSEGTFTDEYSEQELSDGEEVLAWIAAQPWCTADVGMFGISWGGFNSLQLAARRPPALKAIVTVCSTDDRYDNDVHYVGGALLGIDMTAWAGAMFAFNSRPPLPQSVRGSWREMWQQRLDALEPPLLTWLDHQTRDDYWRRGSVGENYADIQIPVLAVGGWADPYHDTVLRLVENLPGVAKGLLGPWAHQYPDRAARPGPAIGFLQETLRWWDRWLRGSGTGVEDDADLRVFLEGYRPPATSYADVPGNWMATPWPMDRVQQHHHTFARSSVPAQGGWIQVRTPQHLGVDSGRFFPYGNITDLPPDQRAEDGRSVCLDSGPLAEDLTLLGVPRVVLHLDSDQPRAHVIVRMCDVAPDGSSRLLARGVLNLSAREGRDRDVPFTPGDPQTVEVALTSVGVTVPAGHVLRFAVSSTYWPWVWPHATPATLHLNLERSHGLLPVLDPARVPTGDEVTFAEPQQAKPSAPAAAIPARPRPQRQVVHDLETDTWTLDVDPAYVPYTTTPEGVEYEEESREIYRIRGDEPTSAENISEWDIAMSQGQWTARMRLWQRVTANAEEFQVTAAMTAETQGQVVAQRAWDQTIPRTVS